MAADTDAAYPEYVPDLVTIDPSAVAELLTGSDGPVWADLERRAIRVHAAAVSFCNVDTGRLRSSLRWTMALENGQPVALVGSDVYYAQWVDDGFTARNGFWIEGSHFLTNALAEAA